VWLILLLLTILRIIPPLVSYISLGIIYLVSVIQYGIAARKLTKLYDVVKPTIVHDRFKRLSSWNRVFTDIRNKKIFGISNEVSVKAEILLSRFRELKRIVLLIGLYMLIDFLIQNSN
jgi:hypothetical protein